MQSDNFLENTKLTAFFLILGNEEAKADPNLPELIKAERARASIPGSRQIVTATEGHPDY
jgi:hypothetical protein